MNRTPDIFTPQEIKLIEDTWVKISLVNFLVKLMPKLKPYTDKIRVEIK